MSPVHCEPPGGARVQVVLQQGHSGPSKLAPCTRTAEPAPSPLTLTTGAVCLQALSQAPHIQGRMEFPTLPIPTQIFADTPRKAAEDSLNAGVPAPMWETRVAVQVPGF